MKKKLRILLFLILIVFISGYIFVLPTTGESKNGIDADEITINLLDEGQEIVAYGDVIVNYGDFQLKGNYSRFKV